MITESIKGQLQFIYPIFYVMLVVMFASCGFQIKSVSFRLFTLLFIAQSPLCAPKAGDETLRYNIEEVVTVHLQHPDGYFCCHLWLLYLSLLLFFPPHRFLNEAMKVFDATEVVPINFVFFTASAIIAGVLTVSSR